MGLYPKGQRHYQKRNGINRRIQQTFRNIHNRCTSLTDKKYSCYGGRGIKNLLTMEELRNVWERDDAAKMKQPSVDRINSDGNYEIDNIRFIEMADNRKKRALIKCETCHDLYHGSRRVRTCQKCRKQFQRIQNQKIRVAIKSIKYHKKLQREFKMTPKEIANEIHATRQSVYNWFAGRSEPQPIFKDALKNLYDRRTAAG